ncbi:MAG TPA: DUF3467 domain-containing protein [Balneolaceae bacterium]|nr:DUF3467 domain-containing protein [Balneolaceae bacterium]
MPDQSNPMNQDQMEIQLPEEEASGTYSNLVMITHSDTEFVLDFIAIMPGVPEAKVLKRMILTPEHAKRLSDALEQNLKKFEQEHGPISGDDDFDVPFNYRGPTPEA